MITNVHSRRLDAAPSEIGTLLDALASSDDALWPSRRWPPMRFDRPLAVAARGGHGPIRYSVVAYEPGRRVEFEFDPRIGLEGRHSFEVERAGTGTELRHVMRATTRGRMRLAWLPVFRPLHDALIEDSLDRAEAAVAGRSWEPAPLSRKVRLLRRVAGRG